MKIKNVKKRIWDEDLQKELGYFQTPIHVVYCDWCVCGEEVETVEEALTFLQSHYRQWHPEKLSRWKEELNK